MWVIAVYDCPMTEVEQRHDYTAFRRLVIQENFLQLQFSLYARHFPTMAAAQTSVQSLVLAIPEGAKVAFFLATDKQSGMTREYFGGRKLGKRRNKPEQSELFSAGPQPNQWVAGPGSLSSFRWWGIGTCCTVR